MAEDNMLDEIKKEIDNGVDLNKKNEFGWSPLHLAISNEHEEMALLLLACDADPSVQDNDGNTSLHYAAEYNTLTIAESILNISASALHIENKYGEQPLYRAVRNAKKPPFSMVELFLEKGADKDYGEDGSTPFDWAKRYEVDEFIKIFEEY